MEKDKIIIPFICYDADIIYQPVYDQDGEELLGPIVAQKTGLRRPVPFDIEVHQDEWKAGENVHYAVKDCLVIGCDIYVYRYPNGRIVAHCGGCNCEGVPKLDK